SVAVAGRYQVVSVVVAAVGGVGTPSGVVSLLGLGGSSVVLDRSGRGLMVSGSPFSPGVFGLSASFVGDPVFDGSGVSRSLVLARGAAVASLAGLPVPVGGRVQGVGVVEAVVGAVGASAAAGPVVVWV